MHHARCPTQPNPNVNLQAGAAAGRAVLNGAGLSADTFTQIANNVLLQGQLPGDAVLHVLQGQAQLMHDVLGATRPWGLTPIKSSFKKRVDDVH
jgi:hypothetical protein